MGISAEGIAPAFCMFKYVHKQYKERGQKPKYGNDLAFGILLKTEESALTTCKYFPLVSDNQDTF